MTLPTPLPTPSDLVAPAPIEGNGGRYMSPFTSDATVALWVARGRNAQLGAAVGGFIGREAGAQIAGSIPLVGSFLGNRAGQAMGRRIALQMVGGEDYMRETSDLSFDSIDAMIIYMYVHHGEEHEDFAEVRKLTSEIYPEMTERWDAALRAAPRRTGGAGAAPAAAAATAPAAAPSTAAAQTPAAAPESAAAPPPAPEAIAAAPAPDPTVLPQIATEPRAPRDRHVLFGIGLTRDQAKSEYGGVYFGQFVWNNTHDVYGNRPTLSTITGLRVSARTVGRVLGLEGYAAYYPVPAYEGSLATAGGNVLVSFNPSSALVVTAGVGASLMLISSVERYCPVSGSPPGCIQAQESFITHYPAVSTMAYLTYRGPKGNRSRFVPHVGYELGLMLDEATLLSRLSVGVSLRL